MQLEPSEEQVLVSSSGDKTASVWGPQEAGTRRQAVGHCLCKQHHLERLLLACRHVRKRSSWSPEGS